MKTTIQKYYDALCDLRNFQTISHPQSFTKERKIGERFIKTCIELDLITKISSKNYKINNFNPTISLANKIKNIMYNYNNSKRLKQQNIIKPKGPLLQQLFDEVESDKLKEAIEIVKKAGLKVLKPVTEFIEL